MSNSEIIALLINVAVDALLIYGVIWSAMRKRWLWTILCSLGVFYQGIAHGSGSPLDRLIMIFINGIAMAVCFGIIAGKLGKNRYLYGFLFIIPFANLIAIANLASPFRSDETAKPLE